MESHFALTNIQHPWRERERDELVYNYNWIRSIQTIETVKQAAIKRTNKQFMFSLFALEVEGHP